MAKNKQPAQLSYFFSKGYKDLGNTIKESWQRNIAAAKEKFSRAGDSGYFSFGGGVNLVAAISIFTFGSVITAVTSLIHIAVLFFFFILLGYHILLNFRFNIFRNFIPYLLNILLQFQSLCFL